MALNASVLATAIKTQLLANPACGAQSGAALDAMCTAIGTAVVAHIQSAAAVAVTVVTTCPAGAGTGTGTGTVG